MEASNSSSCDHRDAECLATLLGGVGASRGNNRMGRNHTRHVILLWIEEIKAMRLTDLGGHAPGVSRLAV